MKNQLTQRPGSRKEFEDWMNTCTEGHLCNYYDIMSYDGSDGYDIHDDGLYDFDTDDPKHIRYLVVKFDDPEKLDEVLKDDGYYDDLERDLGKPCITYSEFLST